MLNYNTNYLLIQNQNIVFIWQARAACSSVTKMYYNQLGLLNNELLKKRTIIHTFKVEHQKNLKDLTENAIKNKNTKYIQFVVNPFRRAVSSYIHSMRTNYNNNKENDISFETYIYNLMHNKYLPNIHHDKQKCVEIDNKNIEYIKMEKIKNKLDYLNKKYNLNLQLFENIQTHNKKFIFKKPYIGNLLWSEITNDHIPNNYHHFYNGLMKYNVNKLYKEDIETFGYSWEEFIHNK